MKLKNVLIVVKDYNRVLYGDKKSIRGCSFLYEKMEFRNWGF